MKTNVRPSAPTRQDYGRVDMYQEQHQNQNQIPIAEVVFPSLQVPMPAQEVNVVIDDELLTRAKYIASEKLKLESDKHKKELQIQQETADRIKKIQQDKKDEEMKLQRERQDEELRLKKKKQILEYQKKGKFMIYYLFQTTCHCGLYLDLPI